MNKKVNLNKLLNSKGNNKIVYNKSLINNIKNKQNEVTQTY